MVFREFGWLAVHTAIALAGAVIGVNMFSDMSLGTLFMVALVSLSVTLALRFFLPCGKAVGSILCVSVLVCAVSCGPIIVSFTGNERSAWMVVPVVMLTLMAIGAYRKNIDLTHQRMGH